MIVASWFIINGMLPESVEGLPMGAFGVFLATITGLVTGLAVGKVTEYYTGTGKYLIMIEGSMNGNQLFFFISIRLIYLKPSSFTE